MTSLRSCLYVGRVVHARLRPRRHRLAYRVFTLLADLDEIEALDRRLRLFSSGRFNLISFHESDLGDRKGGLRAHVEALLADGGLGLGPGGRISVLCYPRVLGYVFNPLSVYFCETAAGALRAMIYEVSSTFGERRSYVLPVEGGDAGIIRQEAAKEMYVSPFNASDGHYSFHVRRPGEEVAVGVLYRHGGEPVMKALFSGRRVEVTDWRIARLAILQPLMTLKVIAAIHWEAAILWLKGLRPKRHVRSGAFAVSHAREKPYE